MIGCLDRAAAYCPDTLGPCPLIAGEEIDQMANRSDLIGH